MGSWTAILGRSKPLAPGLIGMILATLLLLPELTFADGYDWSRMQLPFKTYYRESLLAGRLPLWAPEIQLGRPFLADIETATLYPPNLLFLLGEGVGAYLSLALHLGLAVWGGLRFGRLLGCSESCSWLGALGFALGAHTLGRLQAGQFQVFCALCWLPLLFSAAFALLRRPGPRPAMGTALVVGLLFLSGSPPIFWIAGWAVALWLTISAALQLSHPSGMTKVELCPSSSAKVAGWFGDRGD